ncbi:deoxyribonuclease IV [Paenibacillus pasadenensis]|uniref:deoxyribonuclease IV n=1 Tax=Paenibacillus pasadenensis TaxID=217090 RepID=UPI00203E45C5|nr:deoxyribonuclease IV [Paenibacillus pasadenensis]MCM3748947.1 deoxyribonuclease IV [Paenibacillus pasadenensis]
MAKNNRRGCHISTRGGYRAAAERAYALGCGSFQYFPKNPRGLGLKHFDRIDAARCLEFCREHNIASIAHSAYPSNLASPDEGVRMRTASSLLNDLDIAESCGSLGVVVHFGAYKERDPLTGYKLMIATLDYITERWQGSCRLLIENMAGNHGFMGMTLEELVQIRSLCREPDKIGFCIDSCHLFASGVWDGGLEPSWAQSPAGLAAREHVKALHINGSVYASGSRRDRHALLGEGELELSGIGWLLRHFPDIPAVLETAPGADGTHLGQLLQMKAEEEGRG